MSIVPKRMASVLCFLTFLCLTSCVAQRLDWNSKDGQLQERSEDQEELPKMLPFLEMLYKLYKFGNGIEQRDGDVMEKEKKSGRMWDNMGRCSYFFWKTWAVC
ncbi:hypothetical protein WMY93_001401 [Mugilogobius chulae]|uniref:Uncharacterized protein n=1 Tax=Mugilogobius chulae TaxID=88201 RepID=A0AAW0Q3Q1_9GOBI